MPFCKCGAKITEKPIHKCECGRKWLWKMRSNRYVFAGLWKDFPTDKCVCGREICGEDVTCECGRKWVYNRGRDRYMFKGGKSEVIIDGQRVIIEYVTANRVSIIVKCPRCGKDGRLVIHSRGVTVKYDVKHDRGACKFGFTSDGYEVLDRIYKKIRGGV